MKAEIYNQLVDDPHSAFDAQDPEVETGIVANSSAPVCCSVEVEAVIESLTFSPDGNVVALIAADGGGELSAIYDYDPFGNLIRATGAAAALNPFRFSTKYHLDYYGLYYYGFRYYKPSLGRFLNRDPIEELGGLNLHGFVGNDPVNHWDYLGLCSVEFDIRFLTAREARREQAEGRVKIDYRTSVCYCCEEVRLIQIVRGEAIIIWPPPAYDYEVWRIDGKPDDEWPEGDPGRILNPFPYYPYQSGGFVRNGSATGQMVDDPIMPGFGGGMQYFEICLICTKGQNEGKIIGCRTWVWETGHFRGRRGRGGGTNLPGQEPSRNFMEILRPHGSSFGGFCR